MNAANVQQSASTAHKALLQIGLMLMFVVIAVTIAGMSDGAGDAMAAFMFGLLVLQGVTHGQSFSNFLTKVGV